jgi:hypothetical protein
MSAVASTQIGAAPGAGRRWWSPAAIGHGLVVGVVATILQVLLFAALLYVFGIFAT